MLDSLPRVRGSGARIAPLNQPLETVVNAPTNVSKTAVIAALDAWIRQRPGLEFGNYGDIKSYRAELRQITRDLHEARTLLRAVELRESITGDDIVEAAKHAYSGRLSIKQEWGTHKGVSMPARVVIDYCAGQYWPTEYRRAVCAVLASVLWAYFRDGCMPAPVQRDVEVTRSYGTYKVDMYTMPGGRGKGSAGDWLRATASREFGRSIAGRWFN